MGKIFNSIPSMIMEAMKAKECVEIDESTKVTKADALRNLKAKMLEWKTSKEGAKVVNANNGEIPDSQELVITKKYVAELLGDVEIYKTAKPTMAKAAQVEADYLTPFLPQEATAEEIENCVKFWMGGQDITSIEQKQMGIAIKFVKNELENADGKLVSEIVRKYIK